MPQVTLSVPQEKLPLLNNVLLALGIENDKINPGTFASDVSRSVKESANAIYNKYFTWEYYSNELEYE